MGKMFFGSLPTGNEEKARGLYLLDDKTVWLTPALLIYKPEHSSHIFRLFTFSSKVV